MNLSQGFFYEITYFFFSLFSVSGGLVLLIIFFYKFNQKIFPKINFILGNNTVEAKGVKSNCFGEDLMKTLFNQVV